MEWYLKVLRQYADFSGRARRKEYWMAGLINLLISLVISMIDNLLFGYPILSLLYWLFIVIPFLAVTVRRLHDVGKSGWWYLIIFVPIIGVIWLLVLLVTDSMPGENKWGPSPKYGETAFNM